MRLMKINPKYNGGMLRTRVGLKPILNRIKRVVSGSGNAIQLTNKFNQLSVKQKKPLGVKPLKFLM
jgi:hypothetical protein